MDVIKLVERAYEINKSNGWHAEKRDWEELCLLMVSEVVEALEDYRDGLAPDTYTYTKKGEGVAVGRQPDETWKPCGIPSELADILIRIADTAGLYEAAEELGAETQTYLECFRNPKNDVFQENSFPVNLNRIVRILAESSRSENDFSELGYAFAETMVLAKVCGIDIERAVNEKLAYNATRGHRHGGKVI